MGKSKRYQDVADDEGEDGPAADHGPTESVHEPLPETIVRPEHTTDSVVTHPSCGWYKMISASVLSRLQGKKGKSKRYQDLAEDDGDGTIESVHEPLPENVCPEHASASLFSRLTFGWLNSLLKLGKKRALEMSDLWELHPMHKADTVSKLFEKTWASELQRNKPSFTRALVKTFGWTLLRAGRYKVVHDLIIFVAPFTIKLIVEFVEDSSKPWWLGLVYCCGLLVCSITQSVILHQYFHECYEVGMNIHSAVITTIYRKSMRTNVAAMQQRSVGEVTNLMAVDSTRIQDLMPYIHVVWSGPMQMIITMCFLIYVTGIAAFAGLIVMIVVMPVSNRIGRLMEKQNGHFMKAKDARVKTINEILGGMKIIKMFNWERSFLEKITRQRQDESKYLKRVRVLYAANSFTWGLTPVFVSVTVFAIMAIVGWPQLSPSRAFTALSLFALLRFPLIMVPMIWSMLVQAKVAIERIENFLLIEESENAVVALEDLKKVEVSSQREGESRGDLNGSNINGDGAYMYGETGLGQPVALMKMSSGIPEIGFPKDTAVGLRDATFAWESDAVLRRVDMMVPKGSFVCIVGPVGCGKSSLLSSILHETKKLSGEAHVNGTIAYAPQNPWVLNGTLRDNVLFGEPYDEDKYHRVISSCSLDKDMDQLPHGDMSMLGEKGITLSGGQKARVSLARLTYSRSDIAIMDDPLSAVDAHVGRHLFENVLMGELLGRTRILVTHQLGFLSRADVIYVLKNGEVVEYGHYDELMRNGEEFSSIIHEHVGHEEEVSNEESDNEEKGAAVVNKSKSSSKEGELMTVEDRATGRVSMSIYASYFRSVGILVVLVVLVALVLTNMSRVSMDYWLGHWSKHSQNEGSRDNIFYYMFIYALLAVSTSIFEITHVMSFVFGGVRASLGMHTNMLHTVMRAPMSFFDTTPVGRILNRFSANQDVLDLKLPESMTSFLSRVFNVAFTFLVITIATYQFMFAVIPLGIVYHYLCQYYLATSRELKRLENISKSPIYAHFSESLSGVSTIRAYGAQGRFMAENEYRIDTNHTVYYLFVTLNRWLGLRVEILGAIVIALAASLAVMSRSTISSEVAGMSVTYAIVITGSLNWLVRMQGEVETNMNAVERVEAYCNLPSEALDSSADRRPPDNWPMLGQIEFHDVKMRYRSELDLALKGISVKIRPREKIGVVGRTGAGKSSLSVVLFRLVELAGGNVFIDGFDIRRMRLSDLRSRLAIIPQDPVLFEGTIRSNLDPWGSHNDNEIWDALESAHLKNHVSELDLKLESAVVEGGVNFSVGQRQLMCMARALLRNSKILVLDEATASCDVQTDALIQQTIRRRCKDCTIITVAHRLHTIIDYDRVMVLDQGNLAEFSTPAKLLDDANSIFYSLVAELGPNAAAKLRTMANASVARDTVANDAERDLNPLDRRQVNANLKAQLAVAQSTAMEKIRSRLESRKSLAAAKMNISIPSPAKSSMPVHNSLAKDGLLEEEVTPLGNDAFTSIGIGDEDTDKI